MVEVMLQVVLTSYQLIKQADFNIYAKLPRSGKEDLVPFIITVSPFQLIFGPIDVAGHILRLVLASENNA